MSSSAYTEQLLARHGRSLARLERATLSDTLDSVGPDAPTLCGDWDTRHLAAHLVLREGTLGAGVSPLPRLGDRAVDLLAGRREYADLVASLRAGPPRVSFFALPGIDKRFNLLEYYVHHEDVRRAAPGWTPRSLPGWAEDKLWAALPVMAKLTMRRSAVGVTLVRADTGERFQPVSREPGVEVTGLPSELVLLAFGRADVAQVEVTGDDDAVLRFRRARFSV